MSENNISIIIPTYNSAVTLGRCLNSVFQQSMKPQEIIVVDDGSTDSNNILGMALKTTRILEIAVQPWMRGR